MKQSLNRSLVFAFIFAILWSAGCKDEIYQPLTATLKLTVEDTRVTEAVLQVKATVETAPWKLLIQRNGQTAYLSPEINRAAIDTTIEDDWLSPNQSYVYKAYYLFNLTVVDSSLPVATTTMDTTSGNYTWQMFTLGDGYSEGFRDVAIISDTSVWATGQIFVDTGGTVPDEYNAAKWDGKDWKLIKVPVRLQYATSVLVTDQDPIVSVFAPTPNDVWFVSNAGGVTRYLDTSWVMMDIPYNQGPGGGAKKIWGDDSSDMYIGAGNGVLTRFNGTSWQELESGTTLDIQDIWGGINSATGNLEILAVAADPYTSYDRTILKISGTTVTTLSDSGIQYPLSGVWFSPGKLYCVAGYEFYQKNNPYDSSAWKGNLISYYLYALRGSALNDMVVTGDYGYILHFNGVGWRLYLPATYLENGWNMSVATKGDLIVAVGMNNEYGVITMGKR
jgi:hypothetical protein